MQPPSAPALRPPRNGSAAPLSLRCSPFLLFLQLALTAASAQSLLGPGPQRPRQLVPADADAAGAEFPWEAAQRDAVSEGVSEALPFDDLSGDEISRVAGWLMQQPELAITEFTAATMSDNYIWLIALFPPNKKAVLAHLDRGGPKPPRFARVQLFRGASDPPDVVELKVGPLDGPPEGMKWRVDPTVTPPFPFKYRREDVKEFAAVGRLAYPLVGQLRRLLLESFGVNGVEDCEDRCIRANTNAPVGIQSAERRASWVSFEYDWSRSSLPEAERPTADWLLQLPLYVGIDHTAQDPDQHFILGVWYGGQMFPTAEALLAAYDSGGVPKVRYPDMYKLRRKFVDLARRGSRWSPANLTADDAARLKRRPTVHSDPDGPRFSVRGRRVRWQGWDFTIGLRQETGFVFWDVRFGGERLVYEMGLQEAMAHYSARDPLKATQYYSDSMYDIGAAYRALWPQYDCPDNAVYLDSVLYEKYWQAPRTRRGVICVFEKNLGKPIRTHMEGRGASSFAAYGGAVGTSLVVRGIGTVGNYDYVWDYEFHVTGAINAEMSMSGYLSGTGWLPLEGDYGTRVEQISYGPMHTHVGFWKIDADIKGQNNSVQVWEVVPEVTNEPWTFGPLFGSKINRYFAESEKRAALTSNFTRPRLYLVVNENATSQLGNPRGYAFQPNNAIPVHQPESPIYSGGQSWMKYQVASTVRREDEPYGASVHDGTDPKHPLVVFDRFLEDDQPARGVDLVTWVSSGLWHLPHTEDVPCTTTLGNMNGFMFRPYNYFDFDQSMSLGDTDFVFATRRQSEPAEGEGAQQVLFAGTLNQLPQEMRG